MRGAYDTWAWWRPGYFSRLRAVARPWNAPAVIRKPDGRLTTNGMRLGTDFKDQSQMMEIARSCIFDLDEMISTVMNMNFRVISMTRE
jgi:hypothetical protein